MMAFILATDFDFIAYNYEQNGLFLEAFFTPMAFLEYDHHTKFERNQSLNV